MRELISDRRFVLLRPGQAVNTLGHGLTAGSFAVEALATFALDPIRLALARPSRKSKVWPITCRSICSPNPRKAAMLRDAGVRSKLFAILAIPTVLLIVATAWLVGGQVQSARQAGQVEALTDVAIQVNRVVHGLQQERSATLRSLQDPTAPNHSHMVKSRQDTDGQLRVLLTKVDASPLHQMSPSIREASARSIEVHGELAGTRASIDAQRIYGTEADAFYGKVIATDLQLPGAIAASATPELAQRLQAYASLSSTIEYASHERDIVELAFLDGTLTEADFAKTSALVAQQGQSLQEFSRSAPSALFNALDGRLAESDTYDVDQTRRRLTDLLKGRAPNTGRATEWVSAANTRITPMVATEILLVADIADTAAATKSTEQQHAMIFGATALFGLGLALMLAFALAQRITQPLRRLTLAAREIGEELPRMVERMQTPGEGPGVVVDPISVESHDEIGRLAEAFNTVNEVTVRVAQEQAALRASIAEMFVNVGRRNQVLLGRQLAQLDQMESSEEDPDVLESLFRLDHLATRMRRNAESLLVLAGIDSTRRLRDTLPLSDVIRTAVGEIEAYERIDLSMAEDPQVAGRHALTVAHLLAELLENATHFSNPGTRVVVAAAVTGHGVDLTITDYGLGMSPEEIDTANENIAHPPVAEIAVSQRLGLFVVGRLAARIGATVVLRRGRSTGTVVSLSLPAAVFEGMHVEAPVVAADSVVGDALDVPVFTDAPAPADAFGFASAGALADPSTDAIAVVHDEPAAADLVEIEQPATRASGRRRSFLPRRSRDAVVVPDVTAVPADLDNVQLVEEAADEVFVPVYVPQQQGLTTDDSTHALDDDDTTVEVADDFTVEVADDFTVEVADDDTVDEQLNEQADDHVDAESVPVAEAPSRRRGLFGRREKVAAPAEQMPDEAEMSDIPFVSHPDESLVQDELVVAEEPVDAADRIDLPPSPDESLRELVAELIEVSPVAPVTEPVVTEPVVAVVADDAFIWQVTDDTFTDGTVTEETVTEETVTDETVTDGTVADDHALDPAQDAVAAPRADRGRGLFRRRRQAATASTADAATEVDDSFAPATPPSEPAAVPEQEPAPAPAPAPLPVFVYAPAVDILPGKPMRGAGKPAAAAPAAPAAPAPARPEARPAPVYAAPAPPAPASDAPVFGTPAVPAAHAGPVAPATVVPASDVPTIPLQPETPLLAPALPPRTATAPEPVPAVTVMPPLAPRPLTSVGVPAGPLRQAVADQPEPVAPSLPTRAPREPVAVVDPGPAPSADLEQLAHNAHLHSSALSELRGLYEPSFTPAVAQPATEAAGLRRRTPRAVETATDDSASEPPARTRPASEVRGMLSGFRAGVERGRAAPAPTDDDSAHEPTS